MTLRKLLLASTAIGLAAVISAPAFAGSDAATQNDIDSLKQQMEMMQQKIDDLQSATSSDAVVSMKKHPTITSTDGNYTFSINGRAHFDSAGADTSSGLLPAGKYNDGANFRRAEIGVSGTIMKTWSYALTYQLGGSGVDGGSSIKEAFISYDGIADTKLQIGAIALPFTLDYATSSNDITFIERPAAVNMMINLGSDDGRSAVGGKTHFGNLFAMAYYTKDKTGQADPKVRAENDNYVGRLAYHFEPFTDAVVHLGASGTYSSHFSSNGFSMGDRPGVRVDDIKYLNTGNLTGAWAPETASFYGPELAFAWGPLRAQGEYYVYNIKTASKGDLNLNSWYAQASWVITGESYKYKAEDANFGGIKPASQMTSKGGIGAWEVAARYGSSDLNDGAFVGGQEDLTTLALNWYPNTNIRFMLNYIHGKEDVSNTTTHAGYIAQGNIDIVALRSQFAF